MCVSSHVFLMCIVKHQIKKQNKKLFIDEKWLLGIYYALTLPFQRAGGMVCPRLVEEDTCCYLNDTRCYTAMLFPLPEVLLSNAGSLNITLSLLETLMFQGSVQISHCCNCAMLSFWDFAEMHSHAGVAGVLPLPEKEPVLSSRMALGLKKPPSVGHMPEAQMKSASLVPRQGPWSVFCWRKMDLVG